ncbi:FliO/MopB family protein [Acidovorax radicis]|jgi:flagellar protein FliO/FliZ|uniref:FliO/MopB family protein n=1 Tax=Acidovorax radicis TaxID=758826 RepID=UPI001CF82733|nr:flagellar biosynthetic protein FliO [Acidovorax radicis]UCU98720.1 flagellar biosynthetic protein FliO [Acidovorax radicis]
MTQTLVVVVLFVGAMATLPWLVRRLQQRRAVGGAAGGSTSRVLSAVAVGPQQRVVTVEVGPEHARAFLILGVTAQQINCLHVLPAGSAQAPTGASLSSGGASFSREIATAIGSTEKSSDG